MSLSKNRILRNSVSFSNESYVLKYEEEMKQRKSDPEDEFSVFDELFLDKEAYVQERMRLLQEADRLEKEAAALAEKELYVQQEMERLTLMQQQFEEHMKEQQRQLEQEKKELYYEMNDLLWDQSLALAEKVVRQTIDTRQLSMITLLKGVIETLPIAFEKLHVFVHPETYEELKREEEGTKETWLLKLIEWKFDFSLGFAEFVIEEDKGYFEYRFGLIFEKLKERLEYERDLKGREE